MPKIKAVKVATPGSAKVKASKLSRGRGRPKKAKEREGTSRKLNYRHKYSQLALQDAIQAVKENRMTLRAAAKEFKVPRKDCKINFEKQFTHI